MINFSLNTCWRLIPTEGDNRSFSDVTFSFSPSQLLENKRNITPRSRFRFDKGACQ